MRNWALSKDFSLPYYSSSLLSPPRHPDLRPSPEGVGKRTLAGTRGAIRVIRYRDGVLRGKGASLLDGYMVATGRIYRLMIAQRMRHSRQAEILDDSGTAVEHTPELIGRLFDAQLDRMLQETKSDDPQIAAALREARRISEEMIRREEFDPR